MNFSAAGELIFLGRGINSNDFDVYSIDVQGNNFTRLTNGETSFGGPVWKYKNSLVFQSGKSLELIKTGIFP
ncbi:MAG: hypothetical protein ACLFQV_02015 [Vulcanimicrobiota bacterium]